MASTDDKPRTFVKKTKGGQTLTRQVTSAQAEVQASYDGYVEQAPAKTSSTGSRSSSSSSSS